MELQLYFFILLFLFFKNMQIKCQKGISEDKLVNVREENSSNAISLKYGEIQEEFITLKNPKYINFNDNMLDKDLLIHLFSINCEIQFNIVDNLGDPNLINKIDDDSYSIKIIKNTSVKIMIRINENNDNNNNRKCPLVINSMNDPNYELKVEEHNLTIFYFDDNLQNINLKYSLKEFLDDSYVLFSFLFHEEASFEINIKENIKYSQKRIISNSHNIFLTKKSFEGLDIKNLKNLNINVTKIGEDNKPVLLAFRVVSQKFKPLILQKNYLNQGFITSNNAHQYYYMEIFKGEEGEIMLHDKRQNGKLIGRICGNNSCTINDKDSFIGNDKSKIIYNIEYKEHIRKIKFNYKNTEKCEKGCYLLISYEHNTFDTINNTIIGFEFTLLTRIWDKNDWSKTNIINIPNNEYIFGYFEKNSINQHYYSILVLDESELIIEIRGKKYKFFYGEGKRKLNTYNDDLDSTKELIIENEMEMTTISNINNTNHTVLSFAIRPNNFFEDIASFYYFRVFQTKDINDLIIPLDSNIENNYKSLNINSSNLDAFFLLKNDYDEFLLNFVISSINTNYQNNLNFIYKYESNKNKTLDISDSALLEIKSKIKSNETQINASSEKFLDDLTNYDSNFILLDFSLRFQNQETFLTFSEDNKQKEIYPQVYSSQIFNINSQDIFKFSSFIKNSYIFIKWINGKGEVIDYSDSKFVFKMDKNDKGKYYSYSLSNNNKQITFTETEDFFLYSKINYNFESEYTREIKDELISEIIKDSDFPIYFFSKLENSSYDINFRIINNNNSFANYSIEGMFSDIDIIKKIEKGENIEFKDEVYAKYDSCSNNGLLEIYEDNYTENKNYIVIKIEQLSEKSKDNVLIQIISLQIYQRQNYAKIPVNQYIVGSINNDSDGIGFYIIDLNIKTEEKIVIEFNKNNQAIELSYSGDYEKTYNEGIEKYIINDTSWGYFFFDINYNNEKAPKYLTSGNYIFRYYYHTKRFIDVVYNFSKIYYLEDLKNIEENISNISIKFENLKIYYNKNNSNNNIYKENEINETINYTIYLNLFLNDNITELLNSTAIIITKPDKQYLISSSNKEENVTANIIFNTTNVFKFEYILQIKFFLNDYRVNDEMLAYTIEMDLKDILKRKKNNGDDDSLKNLFIGLHVIIFVLIMIVIIVFFYIHRMRRKNRDLKEKVLSISFSEGRSDRMLTDTVHSKKDEEYESVFI